MHFYAIQMCEKQTSERPAVLETWFEKVPRDEKTTRALARARLSAAPLPDGTIIGARVPANVFIQVIELDHRDGPLTDRVVYKYKIGDKIDR
jgi:hypothetical protein